MKKLALLAILLAAASIASSAQTAVPGQFSITVAGWSMIGTCQPSVAPNPVCGLPTAVAGQSYTATLATVGLTGTVTCAVTSGALPAWAKLSASGTSCLITGMPTSAPSATFTVTATGTVGALVVSGVK